ncbi:hypothetical protein, conserved [Leishmania tarentolae]|uniref:Uncharacterized protein n=1 Tax=Leishmania tarentolae TaxID=5689 RepID=A0A640KMC5_LEITA|nr:hypothetical protein, conserved [Leishmania tarentolae]
MNVDTLLTRQMELHTSLRQPPKKPQDLVQLMDIMRNYKHYFGSLRTLAERFRVEPETVFQAFMHISVGGTVNFDKQHQDGEVPMHQAKVLPRSKAIALSPKLCKELPNPELMVYVGLSRDLRNTLRVKVEDGNDLKTAEKSVCEAVEYLNYIDHRAHHNTEKLYALYMAEDPNTLSSLLSDGEASMGASWATFQDSLSSTVPTMQLPILGEDGVPIENEPAALPSPLSSFIPELKKLCDTASDVSSVSGGATKRLKASQVILDWIATVPTEYFAQHTEHIVGAVSSTLALLAAEKRSALCRAGCDIIIMLMQRLSAESVFIEDVHHSKCSTNPATFSGALSHWVSSLSKGIYVTIAAISSATDAALRAIAIQSHGHPNVVKALLTALSGGTQTELRRKCLGYLALCVAAAYQKHPERMRELVHLLGPVAVKYVETGDSPSRKMARALCSVLRVLAPATSPREGDRLLHINDERIEALVQQERSQVEPAVLGGPQELENLLFEADTFVSSIRSTFSAGSQRSLVGSMRCRGGQGSSGVGRSGLPQSVAAADQGRRGRQNKSDAGTAAAGRPSTKHSEGPAAADLAERHGATRSPTCQHTTVHAVTHGDAMTEVPGSMRSAVRRHSLSSSGGLSPTSTGVAVPARTRKVSSHGAKAPLGGIYDAEAFLSSLDSTPTSAAKHTVAEKSLHRSDRSKNNSAAHAPPVESGSGGHGGGAAHATAGTPGLNGGHHTILPTLTSARHRTPHADRTAAVEEEGVLPPPRGAAVPSSERLVPLSLRNAVGHGNEVGYRGQASPSCTNGSAAQGMNAPRISQSLRRKIEENKDALGL